MIARSIGRSVGRSITSRGTAAAGGGYDTDAQAYITLVEAADTESLETGVKDAINAFVVGCKTDGIWDAIKASCILAGARTLTGALVPLVGTAPTNNNFVSGDYDRKAGLVGDGATTYLDSNRNNNADPQNDQHVSVQLSTAASVPSRFIGYVSGSGGDTALSTFGVSTPYPLGFRSRNATLTDGGIQLATGFVGLSRPVGTSVEVRTGATGATVNINSVTPSNGNIEVFRATSSYTDARLSFYSIGEALDLALLDSRVSTLMTAIGAAIP